MYDSNSSRLPLPQALLAVLFLTSLASTLTADDPSKLTVERIFGSSEFRAEDVSARWLPDSRGYLTLENSETAGRDIVLYRIDGTREVIVSSQELVPAGRDAPLSIDDYAFSHNLGLLLIYTNSKRVWRRNTRGDYWLLDRSSRELRQLGGDAPESSLMFAKFSPDSRHVAYVRDQDIYLESTTEPGVRRLTLRESNNIINGTFDWVYEEELGLRDGFRWSPDGKSIAYWQLDTSGVREFALVNNTKGLYPEVFLYGYPKVGQKNSASRIGVMPVEAGGAATRWIQIPGDARNHYPARMEWRDDQQLVIQQLNRQQNLNRVYYANIRDGSVQPILDERDAAWVDIRDDMFWIGGDEFTWVSERSGWRHVYHRETDGQLRPITRGKYDVMSVVHADKQQVYFLASPENATQRYLYRTDLHGEKAVRITPASQAGTHSYQISGDGKWAIHSWSSMNQPPVTALVSLPDHKQIRVLADNRELQKRLDKLKLAPAEFFRVAVSEEVVLDGWRITPPDVEPSKRYPLLVYVYGEPAGQTVLDRWGGPRQLWHQMLAQQGYVIVSMDNRGTPAPKGRAWRKCVYKKVGILAPREQAAAVRQLLRDESYLDPQRVGVWGWSGGGSMSLNAIFKYPELYHTAISIAPVPNQRYYDTIYQERYMGLPEDNVEGFRQGSPIHYAHRLQGNLLLIHGTGDDNCHYQTMEMLIDELILHNKPFSMMSYPNRTHAIREGKNTTVHLRNLMTRYLNQNLPAGPR